MATLESLWFKKNKLPPKAKSIPTSVINQMNKMMLETTSKSKSNRGKYADLSATNKLLVAKYASNHGVSAALKHIKFANYGLKESTVRGWKKQYEKNQRRLGRAPKTAEEAGLKSKKRGRKSQLGEVNKDKICEYVKALRKSGTDINKYTTAAAIKSYLTVTKQQYMLQEFGGWVNPMNYSLIREIWKKCGYSKRKKCRKRRGKLNKNAGYLASQYKIRCKLIKMKYNIPDCLEFNFDETKLPIVPGTAYTMDERGTNEVKGEKLDDKRCVTGFLGGARTGEAAKMQYINKGKTKRCHPKMKAPSNVVFDHTKSKNSTPDSTIRFVKNVIIPFKNAQIKKYNLSPNSHALCKWDIFYTHITPEATNLLLKYNVHPVIVPPNMTDDLQEMDKGVNKPMKSSLGNNFVGWRSDQSISQLNRGISPEDVYVDYGLTALKTLHVKWCSNAWKYCEEQGFISDAFRLVDENLVGYTHWDDSWIPNELKNNNFVVVDDDSDESDSY